MAPTLELRPGARFACRGDGLCCTDAHDLGPLEAAEAALLPAHAADPAAERAGPRYLATTREGTCTHRRAGACGLHGSAAKPVACRRFPFGLVATPTTLRVTMAHRCPCVSLTDGPALQPAVTDAALRERDGSLVPDARVGERLSVTRAATLPWEAWLARERDVLRAAHGVVAGLTTAPGLEGVTGLAGAPGLFGARSPTDWVRLAAVLCAVEPATRFDRAVVWCGYGILGALGRRTVEPPSALGWDDVFDAAEARAAPRPPGEVFSAWAEDLLWGLGWARELGLASFASDLATRLAVAADVAARLGLRGARPDRAAAEAVAVMELVGDSEWWPPDGWPEATDSPIVAAARDC